MTDNPDSSIHRDKIAAFYAILAPGFGVLPFTYLAFATANEMPVPEGFGALEALIAGLVLAVLFLTASGRLKPDILRIIIEKIPMPSFGRGD